MVALELRTQSLSDPRPRRRESEVRWDRFTDAAARWYMGRLIGGQGPQELRL